MTDDTRRRINEVTKGLRSSGVLTYVVAIGSRPNVKDLGTIVDRPDDVMTIKTFNDLRPYVDSAVRQIMNGKLFLENGWQGFLGGGDVVSKTQFRCRTFAASNRFAFEVDIERCFS